MAISKGTRRSQGSQGPDAAAFVRLIDEGLAEPEAVSAAYQQALGAWLATGPDLKLDVVAERPVLDPEATPTPEARMITLARRRTFKGGEGR